MLTKPFLLATAILLAVVAVHPSAAGREDDRAAPSRSRYRIEDPAAVHRVDYLIVAGDAFADVIDPLAAHRAGQGYAVGLVAMKDLRAKFPFVRDFLAHAVQNWKEPPPSFLLLVGDADAVPPIMKRAAHEKETIATDFEYALPEGPKVRIHVGRFPCRTHDELQALVDKTIAYETKLPAGTWQRKVALLAGTVGVSEFFDAAIEKLVAQIICSRFPPAFDVEVAQASPASPYCPYPPKFHDLTMRLLNEGSLVYAWICHGSRNSFQSVFWRFQAYSTLRSEDARSADVRNGLPVFFTTCCHAGQFEQECIGEAFIRAPRGPVAFIGGSGLTPEYGNTLFGIALLDSILGDSRTLGEALDMAKKQVLEHRLTPLTIQTDLVFRMGERPEDLEPMRRDVADLYNLLGDPALLIRKPRTDIVLRAKGARVEVEAPGRAAVEITLECARGRTVSPIPPLDKSDLNPEARMDERYRVANDRVIRRWTVPLEGGRGSSDLELPREPGTYVLKGWADGSTGTAEVTVEAKESPE